MTADARARPSPRRRNPTRTATSVTNPTDAETKDIPIPAISALLVGGEGGNPRIVETVTERARELRLDAGRPSVRIDQDRRHLALVTLGQRDDPRSWLVGDEAVGVSQDHHDTLLDGEIAGLLGHGFQLG